VFQVFTIIINISVQAYFLEHPVYFAAADTVGAIKTGRMCNLFICLSDSSVASFTEHSALALTAMPSAVFF